MGTLEILQKNVLAVFPSGLSKGFLAVLPFVCLQCSQLENSKCTETSELEMFLSLWPVTRCLSMAKGFNILLCYNSLSRFPSKLNSSGSTATIGITSRLPPKSLSILAHHKFIKWAILVTSAPAAASMYACLMISAHDILDSARGGANAWRIAWGKLGGKTSANPMVSTRFWRNTT